MGLTACRTLFARTTRLWKAVQTATWRQEGENDPFAAVPEDSDVPPYKSFLDEHLPALRFNYNAISHLLDEILRDEARWDAFFEHVRIKPVLVLYENFAADYEHSTLNVLDRLGLKPPEGFSVEPRMKSQTDGINDDWARRYSELRLGTEFDLVPTVPSSEPAPSS